ncbi:DUF3500 domain-containing protein [Pseudonocardia nematodicida]|uniref:DUF3500 domain-containing protein n=1 Tax=Pseudonocardia nematodicida TaxID=1206997 RepID=A0ABV1K6Q0_9PSEU
MTTEVGAGRATAAGAMAEAATDWLGALGPDLLGTAHAAGPGADTATDAERRRWFYTPTDHGGLTLHDQAPAQQQRAMRLVASGLSTAGYVTVAGIMGLENVLDLAEGFGSRPYRERFRDPGLYHLRVFGDPGSRVWGWRFGGHHVSLNNLVVDGEVVATTPCFLGANPATSPLLGGGVQRPLGTAEDLARDIVRGLPAELAERAVLLERAPSDLVTSNRTLVAPGDRPIPVPGRRESTAEQRPPAEGPVADAVALTATPQGVPASALDDAGRERLRLLLSAYLDRVPAGVSPSARYDDDAALDEVHLAWAGSTEPGAPHYYRLQGPRLLIEWDNTQSDANHAHSVWRDPESDFGLDSLGEHVAFAHR